MESGMFFHPVDGACHCVARDASAFPHRDARFVVGVYGSCHGAEQDEEVVGWVNECHAELRPHYVDSDYVNFAPADGGSVRSIYRHNYDRLAAVKRRYDPDNLFRRNQNVPPAAGP